MRVSMTEVVAFLRQYGQAATDDVFNGVTFWTDDQIQNIADRWGVFAQVKLIPAQTFGTTKYVLNAGNWYLLENDFKVFDDRQVEVTGATWDSNRRIMTFDTDLSIQRSYYVEAQYTNAYEALADLWEQKANQRFDYIDWKAQNNRMAMQQEYEHCVKQRDYYRNKIVRRFKRQKGKWTL